MSSNVTLQFTCPNCDKTHRFTLLPEGEAVKESGEKPARETRTAAEFAEKIQEMKGRPDERAAVIRRQLADLQGKEERSGRPLPEGIKEELLQRKGKAGKKGHAPELSKKRRSRLLNRRLKGRPASSRNPETSALLDIKLAKKRFVPLMSPIMSTIFSDKGNFSNRQKSEQ